jgi:hypothetical protein
MAIKARYTEQIVLMVKPEVRQALEQIADEEEISIAAAARRAIDAGLAQLVKPKPTRRPRKT